MPPQTPPIPDKLASGPWTFDVCASEEAGERLDKAVLRQAAARGLSLSRAAVARWIDSGHVRLDQKPAKAATRLRSGQRIDVIEPPLVLPDSPVGAAPTLTVLFEDEHLLVIDKPAHLPVHPGAGVRRTTLSEALLARGERWSGIGGVARPGIVHRLDADTTGVLVVAKHDQAHRHLAAQFAARTVRKHYLALSAVPLPASLPPAGTIETGYGRHPQHRHRMTGRLPSASRRARTSYRVLEQHAGRTLLELRLWTGRTHQARVHLAEMGLPVLGDRVYGSGRALAAAHALGLSHHALHAWKLSFHHPLSDAPMTYSAQVPASWRHLSPCVAGLTVCEALPPSATLPGSNCPHREDLCV